LPANPDAILCEKIIVANLPLIDENFRRSHAFPKIGVNHSSMGKSVYCRARRSASDLQEEATLKSFLFRLAIAVLSFTMTPATSFADDPPPAKKLFGAVGLPTRGETESIGFYAKGCLMGGIAIPSDGPTWQVLHPSRNRRWGNPAMIGLIERLSREAHDKDGWNGLLIGDIAQPRGGPMLNGHASHQIGLDADIWLTPMPDRKLSDAERDHFPENNMLRKGTLTVDDRVWNSAPHEELIMRAASYPEVERIFVHPGIKKKLCDTWTGDRSLLSKVRPMYGHNYHFHIRIKCPPGSTTCTPQVAPPTDSGCGKPLADWFALLKPKPKPANPPVKKPTKVYKPKYLMLSGLPKACTMVLNAKSVSSMAAAEYRGPGQVDDDDSDVAMNTETAYATPTEPATAVAFRSIDDFSVFVPAGNIPLPRERPGENW
jgi:penicillin-insensitive murein endopeptidase